MTTSSTDFIIGHSHGFHDAAVAVINCHTNQIEFARQTERVTGIKHDKSKFDFVMPGGRTSQTAFYERPRWRQARQLMSGEAIRPKEQGYDHYISHHWAHAAAAYYTRPQHWIQEPVCVVIDAIGEFDTASIWYKKKKVWSMKYPVSLGLFYSAITDYLGMQPNRDEHLTMAMAGLVREYDPDILDTMRDLGQENLHKGIRKGSLGTNGALIASTAQKYLEQQITHIMMRARKYSKNLCYGGGVALNCVANANIARFFDDVWIFPNPGDAGAALGAALAVHDKRIEFTHNFLGQDIQYHDAETPKNIAKHILNNGVAGIVRGRDEFGPRALGNRSLLADPRGSVAERLYEIKERKRWSPVAPAILAEHYHHYFRGTPDSYMGFVATSGANSSHMPMIRHVDKTSRVQCVRADSPSIFRKVLEEWYDLTNCPILINTSLNFKGKPVFSDIDSVKNFERENDIRIF